MISVCIATYNAATYLREQLESIRCQLSAGDEIIISDQSTDNTLDIIQAVNDRRIKVVKGPAKHSPCLNFENALRHAHGDYIFLSDQDDIWKKDKIAISMKWLAHYDCIVSDAEMADKNLHIMHNSYYAFRSTHKGRLFNLIVRNGYMGCCMAFNRKVLDASLPFPKDIPMHDIWIGNVAAWRFKLAFIPEKLIIYRCHSENSSFTSTNKSGYSISKRMKFRWLTFKNLFLIKK